MTSQIDPSTIRAIASKAGLQIFKDLAALDFSEEECKSLADLILGIEDTITERLEDHLLEDTHEDSD